MTDNHLARCHFCGYVLSEPEDRLYECYPCYMKHQALNKALLSIARAPLMDTPLEMAGFHQAVIEGEER